MVRPAAPKTMTYGIIVLILATSVFGVGTILYSTLSTTPTGGNPPPYVNPNIISNGTFPFKQGTYMEYVVELSTLEGYPYKVGDRIKLVVSSTNVSGICRGNFFSVNPMDFINITVFHNGAWLADESNVVSHYASFLLPISPVKQWLDQYRIYIGDLATQNGYNATLFYDTNYIYVMYKFDDVNYTSMVYSLVTGLVVDVYITTSGKIFHAFLDTYVLYG